MENNAILDIVDFVQISKNGQIWQCISLNFDPKRVFLDFLESLGCPRNLFGFFLIGTSMFM